MMIDVREKDSYLKGHIPGSIWIPYRDLMIHPFQYLQKEKNYTIYCNSGVKSEMLVSYLNSLGYHCVNLEGGYSKYLSQN